MARTSPSPWPALVVVCFAQLMVILDATIVNVALPSIRDDLKLTPADLQWIINSYTLVFGGFLLLGGRAADLIGRRKLFVAGTVIFTVASLLNAIATSGEWLIVSRGLQGLGGALASPAALSIITTGFAEGEERTKAMGIWGGIAAAGGALGLLLGGILTDLLAWEWIFIVNIPIGIGVVLAAYRWVPESRMEGERPGFDLAGAVSVTAGLIVLVYAIVKAEQWGWGSGRMLGLTAVALALLAAFLVIETRSPAPLVRLSLFRIRSLAGANIVMLVIAGALFSMFFFATIYLQSVVGFSPLEAGFGFLPVSVGIGIGAGLSQQLIRRIGVKPVTLTGMTVASLGLIVLSQTTTVDGTYLKLLAGLFPMAVGMGLTFVPLTLIATTNIRNDDAGLASGVFNTSQQVGGALGLAILSTLATNKTLDVAGGGRPDPAAFVEGYQLAFTISAALMVFGLVIIATMVRRRDVALIDTSNPVPVAA